MSKVAIVTFLSDNYGTCLQAFALKKAIEKLGHQADILNIERKRLNAKPDAFSRVKSLLSDFPYVLPTDIPNLRKVGERKRKNFSVFRATALHPTEIVIHDADELLNMETSYDMFVAGSDMVWSVEYKEYADIYFMSGIPYEKSGSYAPSFGSVELDDNEKIEYANYLKTIKFLSCRESSGVKLIHDLTGRDVVLTLDPTLLFTAEEWINILDLDEVKVTHGTKYVLVNCFGQLPVYYRKKLNEIKKLTEACQVRFLNTGRRDVKSDLKNGTGDYGPREFVALVKDCAFSMVNGYHGLLFSIIFEKPFLAYHREEKEHWSKHEDRMTDMLDYLKLGNRYSYYKDPVDDGILHLDYTEVNKKLAEMRKSSWDYLDKMLQ